MSSVLFKLASDTWGGKWMVVIRWTLNLLVVVGMALVMRHASESTRMGLRLPDAKTGILRAAAFRP